MADRPKPTTWIGYNSYTGAAVKQVFGRETPGVDYMGLLSWRQLIPAEVDRIRANPTRFLYHEEELIERLEVRLIGGGAVVEVGGDPAGVRIEGVPAGDRATITVNGVETYLTSDEGAEDSLILIAPESAGIIAVNMTDTRFFIDENPIYITAKEPA